MSSSAIRPVMNCPASTFPSRRRLDGRRFVVRCSRPASRSVDISENTSSLIATGPVAPDRHVDDGAAGRLVPLPAEGGVPSTRRTRNRDVGADAVGEVLDGGDDVDLRRVERRGPPRRRRLRLAHVGRLDHEDLLAPAALSAAIVTSPIGPDP